MEHDVIHDLDQRLRAARPAAARVDENAFDADLLTRLRDQPIGRRRRVPRAVSVPVAAGVALTATAVVMLGGGPGEVGGPSSAAAITQALHWLSPPAGKILHVRSVETQGGRSTTREFWQSADDPSAARLRVGGFERYETSGDDRYDPATNTIHVGGAAEAIGKPGGGRTMPTGDPIVAKVKTLLQDRHLEVTGRVVHNGTEAWEIALTPDAGRPVWKLWVATADGKPLELRDPGRDANEAPQVIRWPTYEVLPGTGARKLLTLKGAHPTADVVHD
jgi:hypothetical protein